MTMAREYKIITEKGQGKEYRVVLLQSDVLRDGGVIVDSGSMPIIQRGLVLERGLLLEDEAKKIIIDSLGTIAKNLEGKKVEIHG